MLICVVQIILELFIPGGWIIVMELYPGFSLYRGLYELGQYSFLGDYMGTHGMRWENLGDSNNGMKEVLIIMFVEWLVVLPIAFYVDQVVSSGSGVKRTPLFFFRSLLRKSNSVSRKHSLQKQGSKVFVDMEKADVVQEVILFLTIICMILCSPHSKYLVFLKT